MYMLSRALKICFSIPSFAAFITRNVATSKVVNAK